ncbi:MULTISPECIES: mechanosensitive ion channel family protein [unclassified Imperialibacter]|uniref:mechanosensitive ion channel family protein n=1 Tax=unclassified Imperialibacter TaxID=2629706 RepID=UPI001258594E|nr:MULTISPECIES: mechanosensitive ion channel domain-containing protein [unclassified Imperialibacter]CAD5279025.1 Mechanosensitive ion channel protein MscS [Imperialibacter sp. 89]CAD5293127.1 Mechanosensitive ion channel protein MscS [Imperialibacter sp. 75]VVS99114.1 Mechanosensitive ion channel protein MscS [Imperialibacter sp. EC-SDR9]
MEKADKVGESIKGWWASFNELLQTPLFSFGDSQIDLGHIFYLLVSVSVLVIASRWLMRLVVNKLLKNTDMEKGMLQSVATLVRFGILVLGFIVIFQSAGIDLSSLSILAGALGVGIGFGLQNITNNFISGLIILFERPIKVGDRIEVGDIAGDVISINARATTIITNDNISVIVPNSEFISGTVINWSHSDRNVRFLFPVGVSYKEDPEKVKKILLEVADKNQYVLKSPPPTVMFDEFGDSSLNFYLGVWTSTHIEKPRVLKSELYFEIFKKFTEHNIEIPFPQRDLHIKTSPVTVEQIQSKLN